MTAAVSRLLSAAILLSATLAAAPAMADSAKALGKFGDWSAFAYGDKSGKICYAVGKPGRSMNSPKGRAEAYVTITHRPSDKSFDVVSVTQGYAFKKDAVPEMDVSGARFDLYTQDASAWSRNDKAIVQAMLKAKQVIVHGQPVKGDASADTYSLDGFAKAYAEIGKACGK
ncbi:MAG TPA: invasion associated locus B family protein [Candidatus Sulfotelmatobacter sp.]|jgi:hypothetical protein|nr:invasion associated locus B family protein [Candidatus Sulfotelmatobacter sp.]